jgi:uncharacterized protein YdaU (DUF1376 family)
MAAPPYQKLFWGSYHKHTAHLGHAREHGAYLLLIGALWNNEGKLPADDDVLAGYAKLTTKEWLAIKPKLMPLFKVVRGKLMQPRVTEDLAKYRDTSGKRKSAGKTGGEASAGNRALNRQANASDLPTKPEPEPKEESTPSPQGGEIDLRRFAKGLLIAADAGCSFALMVERIHQAQPVVDGKRRSTAPDVQRALGGALKRGGMPSAIWSAVRAFYALPASTKDGGQFANGAAVVLNKDRWKEYLPDGASAAPIADVTPVYDGPPDIRAWVATHHGEPYARSYVDPARWDATNRALLAANPFAVSKLARDLADITARWKFSVTLATANDPKPDLFAQGAAA